MRLFVHQNSYEGRSTISSWNETNMIIQLLVHRTDTKTLYPACPHDNGTMKSTMHFGVSIRNKRTVLSTTKMEIHKKGCLWHQNILGAKSKIQLNWISPSTRSHLPSLLCLVFYWLHARILISLRQSGITRGILPQYPFLAEQTYFKLTITKSIPGEHRMGSTVSARLIHKVLWRRHERMKTLQACFFLLVSSTSLRLLVNQITLIRLTAY